MQNPIETLVTMVNKIVTFMESQSPGDTQTAAAAVASHLKMFWAPSMRRDLVESFTSGELLGLHPIGHAALQDHRAALGV